MHRHRRNLVLAFCRGLSPCSAGILPALLLSP
jgi:hypothetical protein